MTWAQSSKRKITMSEVTTPKGVGPGSYNIKRSILPKQIAARKSVPEPLLPRKCLPIPEFVTPGPGSYFKDTLPLNRPASSVFNSRTTRDVYKVTSETPSSAEYFHMNEWGKGKEKFPPPFRPKRKQHAPSVPITANYLDEKGRLVRRPVPKRTQADIGPGTYDVQETESVKVAEINKTKRSDDLFSVGAYDAPPPTKYNIVVVQTKIPISIRPKPKTSFAPPISQSLGNPIEYKPQKGMTHEFKSIIPRKIYEETDETPGPGAYQQERKQCKAALYESGVVFGSRAVRFDKNTNYVPAPDSYDPHNVETNKDGSASVLKNRAQKGELFPTNDVIGPGAYNISSMKFKPQMSPAFAAADNRMPSSDNGLPGPSDYTIDFPSEKPVTVFGTRYNKINDWRYSAETDAPSPQKYTIDRDLHGRACTVSRNSRFLPQRKSCGPEPCTYDVSMPFVKPSFNSAVPRPK